MSKSDNTFQRTFVALPFSSKVKFFVDVGGFPPEAAKLATWEGLQILMFVKILNEQGLEKVKNFLINEAKNEHT